MSTPNDAQRRERLRQLDRLEAVLLKLIGGHADPSACQAELRAILDEIGEQPIPDVQDDLDTLIAGLAGPNSDLDKLLAELAKDDAENEARLRDLIADSESDLEKLIAEIGAEDRPR